MGVMFYESFTCLIIAQYKRERWKSGGNKPERLMTMRPGNVNMEKLLQAAVTTASPHPSCVCVNPHLASTAAGHLQEAGAIS